MFEREWLNTCYKAEWGVDVLLRVTINECRFARAFIKPTSHWSYGHPHDVAKIVLIKAWWRNEETMLDIWKISSRFCVQRNSSQIFFAWELNLKHEKKEMSKYLSCESFPRCSFAVLIYVSEVLPHLVLYGRLRQRKRNLLLCLYTQGKRDSQER